MITRRHLLASLSGGIATTAVAAPTNEQELFIVLRDAMSLSRQRLYTSKRLAYEYIGKDIHAHIVKYGSHRSLASMISYYVERPFINDVNDDRPIVGTYLGVTIRFSPGRIELQVSACDYKSDVRPGWIAESQLVKCPLMIASTPTSLTPEQIAAYLYGNRS